MGDADELRILVACRRGGDNGIETYTALLASELAHRGHQVVVASLPSAGERARPAGVSERRLAPGSPRVRRVIGPFESDSHHAALVRIAREEQCDVLHATYPEFVPRGAGLPVVATCWHPALAPAGRALSAHRRHESPRAELLFALSDRRAFRRAQTIAAVSLEAEAELRRRGISAALVPPFLPDDVVRSTGVQRQRSCVFISRWLDTSRKGFPLALAAVIEARRSDPDLQFDLVGEWRGGSRPTLPEFCHEHGLLSRNELFELLGRSGCLLLTSAWEEVGYVGLEALAVGTAIVCGPLPAFEGLEADAGIVRPRERTPHAFAKGIGRALLTTDHGFRFPERHLASSALARLEQLYDAVTHRVSRKDAPLAVEARVA